jgi:hypothetical protein
MGRLFIFAALLYGYGDPGFDGHRPAALDRPLRNFHTMVDSTARDAQRILITFDNGASKLRKLGANLRRVGEALAPGPD